MQQIEGYREIFNDFLKDNSGNREPNSLYDPVHYILDLGGKRLRPVLTLMVADIFSDTCKPALDAAMAVEVFHNFSLIHDDIMDAAPLRRGKRTVHEKWDVNTGILSGDAMLIWAYQFLETYPDMLFKNLVSLFSKTAQEVCEGQQYDIDFESRDDVTIPEYLKMICYKTAVLVAAAMKMGAMVAGTSKENQENIYDFGKNLGLAFQLQDDYLDAFGNPENFGKQVGGDIIENKKTFLYLKARELGTSEMVLELEQLFSIKPKNPEQKIGEVKEIYEMSGAAEATRTEIEHYTRMAYEKLESLEIAVNNKEALRQFALNLMHREV